MGAARALDALLAGVRFLALLARVRPDIRSDLVDLGEVNGRVFVNNVSMGLYAEAVQSEGYRDAKIRTLLDTAPTVLGSAGSQLDLRWSSPDGVAHASAATILVSNNPYRLGRVVASGDPPANGYRSARCGRGRDRTVLLPADGG